MNVENKKYTKEGPISRGRFGRGRFGHGRRIESPKNIKKAFLRLFAYLGSQVFILFISTLFILISVILQVIAPAVIGNAIKQYLELTQNMRQFIHQIIILLIIYLSSYIVNALSSIFMVRMGNHVVFRLRKELFHHIQTLSLSYFDKKGIGDIISRLTNDIEVIYNALANGFFSLVSGLFTIIGVIIGMLLLNIQLSIIVISIVPIMVFIAAIIGRKVRTAFRENQEKIGLLSSNIQESISGVKVIQSFHREEEEFKLFRELNNTVRKVGIKANFTASVFMPVLMFLTSFALSLLIGIGGALILTAGGVFSIGLLTSFILYARRFFQPLRQITNVYNVLQSALAGAERVFDILDTKSDIKVKKDAIKLENIEGSVEFKDVTFGYRKNKNVLENISLKVKEGEKIAIVGPTGAGKTTLVNLISRFYDVKDGKILIDNKEIKDIEINSLRRNMGVVLQEPFFFAASIKENIKYGNLQKNDEDVIHAAKIANAHDFIRKLPEGYDTVLSERGLNLSGGQRQLLAIARAVIADPKILILDEATSNIDSLTEAHIQEALLKLMERRTCFIIAHRLSTIKEADQVVVIHNKKIIEQGAHKELLSRKGFYYRLYNMQLFKVDITEEMQI